MRKILAILVASAIVCAFAPAVGANTDTIVVTLSPNATADIEVDQPTWAPSVGLGSDIQTAADWANLTNEGYVDVLVEVNATNTAAWTLAETAAHDAFKLATIGVAKTLTVAYQTFVADLPASGTTWQTFGLNVTMPTSSSTNISQTTTITFKATVL
jgi:hypothetical protein